MKRERQEDSMSRACHILTRHDVVTESRTLSYGNTNRADDLLIILMPVTAGNGNTADLSTTFA